MFRGCKGLKGDLIIPDSVKSIGAYAFEDCTGFNGKLVLSKCLETIKLYAFANCGQLSGDLRIPQPVQEIEFGAFENCKGFDGKYTLLNDQIMIADGAFKGCTGIKGNIEIPNEWTTIPDNAFNGFSGIIGELIIPENITHIGDGAFANCSGLVGQLKIPEEVTYIGGNAFAQCSGFDGKLIIPENVNYIGYGAFSSCQGFTGDLIIPNNVTYIGGWAFSNCDGFSGKLTLPNGIKKIEPYTFWLCSGLKGSVIVPENVTSIGTHAFDGCESVTYITIPKSVTSIEDYSPGIGNKDYKNILYRGTKQAWKQIKKGNNLGLLMVHVNCKKINCTKWIPSKRATMKNDGKEYVKCKNCGAKVTRTIERISYIKWPKAKWTYADFKANGASMYRSMHVFVDEGQYLFAPQDFSVIFKDMNGKRIKNYEKVGKYKCTLTFKGNYEGVYERIVIIIPNSTTITNLKSGDNRFTAKWTKRTAQVTGYQVRYATNKKFNNYKTVTIKGVKNTSKTIKNLKNKKTYYVKVRTYKNVNGTKFYSNWSPVKTVKTK